MTSRRVPLGVEPNAWSRRRQARLEAGERLLDLSDFDPTRAGLSPLASAQAALAALAPAVHRPEPAGSASARAAVAAALADRGARVTPERIVLTSSTSGAYAQLFRLLADPGERVLGPVPGYPLIEPIARAEGVRYAGYPLRYDGAWRLDREALERAARGARALVVIEPSHPTGAVLDPDDRAFVVALARRERLAIVADEVFGDFPAPGAEPPATWLNERSTLTFVLGGLSKRCGLPHLKLGWIVVDGPDRERRDALAGLDWLADLFLSVASPVQAALPALLDLRHAFGARVRERVRTNLAALDALAGRRPELSRLPLAGGWSAVLRVPAWRGDEAWALALLERGVSIHPGALYDFVEHQHLVASLIVEPAVMAEGLARLEAELASAPP